MLKRYLVGDDDVHGMPGLFDRITEFVEELVEDEGPTYKSGSVSGVVDHRGIPSSVDERHVFHLYLRLRAWLGLPNDPVQQARWLAENRKTDVELLLGPRGLIRRSKDRARSLLDQTPPQVLSILNLIMDLLGWLHADCDHEMLPMEAPEGITVLVCSACGVRVREERGRWSAL